MLENLWENLTYIVFTSKLKFRIVDPHDSKIFRMLGMVVMCVHYTIKD